MNPCHIGNRDRLGKTDKDLVPEPRELKKEETEELVVRKGLERLFGWNANGPGRAWPGGRTEPRSP